MLAEFYPPTALTNTESEEEDKGLRGDFSASKLPADPEPEPRPTEIMMITCPKCGKEFEPYWFRLHDCTKG